MARNPWDDPSYRQKMREVHRGPRLSMEERFWKKVDKKSSDECWLWIGAITAQGYGNFFYSKGIWKQAHILCYELSGKTVPDGLELDHLCRNRRCVNPLHLDPVTRLVNARRGDGALPKRPGMFCKNGHLFTDENTMWRPNRTGGTSRDCRTCRRESWHRNKGHYFDKRIGKFYAT